MNDSTVSRQWASRPDDQRFLSLSELYDFTNQRADNTKTFNQHLKTIDIYGTEPEQQDDLGELVVMTHVGPKTFTNWSFGQLSMNAGAPASYLRKLTSPLAAACLNEGLKKNEKESMLQANGNDTLRCVTSTTYGRIWDHDVVRKVQEVTAGGSWKIPSASYQSSNPKRATTLYASDRDVFIFLVDEDHPIEIPGRDKPSYRGFYVANSEVGSAIFHLTCFTYDYVCDNRTIWGMGNKQELKIKHSSGAPERFLQEGKKALIEYTNQSTQPLVDQIKRAQNKSVGSDEDEVKKFLQARGLQLATAARVIEQAKMEEGDFRTAWDISNGITAYARSISHQDTRVGIEKIAGKILETA